MARRRIVVLVFLVGIALGGAYSGVMSRTATLNAAPHEPNLDGEAVNMAQRIAPAIDLLLTVPKQNTVYLPTAKK